MGRVWPRHGHRGRPLNSVVSPPVIRYIVLAVGVAASGNVVAMESCERINHESPIDAAYVHRIAASKIPHRLKSSGTTEQLCVDKSLEDQAIRLHLEVEHEHPYKCMTFEKASDVSGVRDLLRQRDIPTWREETSPPSMLVCYLVRDSAKVDKALKEKFEYTWYKKAG